MAKRQLKEYETKARTVRDQIVEVCANPAIYQSEVERAASDYTKAKKRMAGIDGITHAYSRFSSKVFTPLVWEESPAQWQLL